MKVVDAIDYLRQIQESATVALTQLERILEGIDRTEDDRDGWWETSAGAEFGATRLAEVRAAFEEAYTPTDDEREALARVVAKADEETLDYERRLPDYCAEPWEGYMLHADHILAAGFRRTVQGEPSFRYPPDGWFTFGSHAPYPWTGRLEFSTETDGGGMPLWERPIQ